MKRKGFKEVNCVKKMKEGKVSLVSGSMYRALEVLIQGVDQECLEKPIGLFR